MTRTLLITALTILAIALVREVSAQDAVHLSWKAPSMPSIWREPGE